MPTIYQDRVGISLYDAQYCTGTKAAIPSSTIASVVSALVRFQSTCHDFNCTDVRVLATEATREAINSADFRAAIHAATGWTVELLPKEEEGRVGALGVASSCASIHGLVMDLGGGSTQLTWLSTRDGDVTQGEGGSVSLPFGAAALMRRIEEAEASGSQAMAALKLDVQSKLAAAYASLRSSPHSASAETDAEDNDNGEEGFSLFLSGGGFRGWGYLLMDTHAINPYPIPIINGFQVSASAFRDTLSIASHALHQQEQPIFRVSDRRASQVPAVALLVSALVSALPTLSTVRFCQGGVREGALFARLPRETRALAPLPTATTPYAPPSSPQLLALLAASLPRGGSATKKQPLPQILNDVLPSVAHLLHHHAPLPKETRAAAALRCSTTGVLAGVHGLSHLERAALALVLAERWGAEVSDTDAGFLGRLRRLVGPEVEWWTRYLGRVAGFVGDVYPAGVIGQERVGLRAAWEGKGVVGLDVEWRAGVDGSVFEKGWSGIEKVGKKKNWVGGREGWGFKVEVRVSGG